MRKINKLGRRAAALVLAVGLTLSTAAPVLAADADEVQTPAAQTEQQETDTEADEADVDTEADEAVALPELSEDREVAEEDEAAALPELDEDWAVDEAALLKEHKHKWKKEKTVAPTCTEQGYTLYKCEYNIFGYGCTATKKDDFKPALDHNMSDWIVVKATCTTAGEKYKACQRSGCNHKVVEEGYAEAYPALGHDFEGAEWVIEAPTCTTPGQRYQVCKRDGCNQKNIDEAYAEAHPAVGADGPGQGGFILRDAAVLPAGEHIVGGNVHQPCTGLFGSLCQIAGAEGVCLKGIVVVHLAAVHVGVGGAVDDDIRAVAPHELIHHPVIGDIQLRQIHRDHRSVEQLFGDGAQLAAALLQLLEQLCAQLPLAACDNDFHTNVPFLMLSSAACRRPRSSNAGRRGSCRSARRFPARCRGRSSRT